MKKDFVDPEEERFRRKYPRFIGVQRSIELIRSPNVRGTFLECAIGELEDHVFEVFPELVAALSVEPDRRVRNIILGVIAERDDEVGVKALITALEDSDPEVSATAERYLRLSTHKSARRALGLREHAADRDV